MSLAIVSFDAVSSDDINYLSTLENFSKLCREGTLVTQVSSVFITNTYPVHCSVITGMQPHKHGVVENLFSKPGSKTAAWRCFRDNIRTTTLYDEAKKAGIDTCAVFWPVTGGAKILKHVPEVIAEEGKSQILTSLKAGSKWFQLSSFLKYGKQLQGISQPALDDFALCCALEAGKRKNFDLLLLHLTDVDSHKHDCGLDSTQAREAIERADRRLGVLMKAYEGWDFIVFGDHGCRAVTGSIDLNEYWNDPGSYWHLAGGCAFLKVPGDNAATALENAASLTESPSCHIKRILSDAEMAVSGLDREFVLGVEAQDGYCFADHAYKGNHGYSLKNEDYEVFYLASGRGIYKDKKIRGGTVMDIAPLGAKLLGLPLWDMDGKLNMEVYYG